ncbi:VWA-like domain-containing protein [Alloacidobacterium dinghuense]|uniref:VWA-like domain-containing protein n=1 Tax=Alloacidobacterium dinghuense TaxID=2763107 RepID=UPI003D80799C
MDCSGSIHARRLGLFEAEIRSILEGKCPSRVHVLFQILRSIRPWSIKQGSLSSFSPIGGGGTNFAPVFR